MAADQRDLIVYVGCYTTPDRDGHGEGISAYRIDRASGTWRPLGVVARTPNPSFLALHPNGRNLYTVHGGNHSGVSAYRIENGASGKLTELGTVSSGGMNPVHLAVHPAGRWLVVANYSSGTVAVLPIEADGSLSDPSHVITLAGPCGPDAVEQSAPHPHDIPFDPAGSFVAVPDKGLDRVFVFRLDVDARRFIPADPPFVVSAAGAGPRHIAFHRRRSRAYVINELDSTVSVFSFQPGGAEMRALQTVSSLPLGLDIKSTGSEVVVHPSGRFVYVSNRGHDSVGAFSIEHDGDELEPIGWYSTGGETPRAIALDPAGQFLYAANQASHTIATFRVQETTGRLDEIREFIATPSPSSLVFLALG